MEQTVAERSISQELPFDHRKPCHNGTVGTSDTEFQEHPSQGWYARRQTGWSRTLMQSGGFRGNVLPPDKTEVCRDFLRGQCGRGGFCKYRHCEPGGRDDLRLCRDLLRGNCTYGASCKFRHSESDNYDGIRSFGSDRLGNTDDLRKSFPIECKSISPSQKFQNGRYYSGAAPWSTTLQQGAATVAINPGFAEGSKEISTTAQEHGEANKGNNLPARSHFGEYRSRSPCHNFQRGRCIRGSTCPRLHLEHSGYGRPSYDWNPQHHKGVAESSGNPGANGGSRGTTFRTSQEYGRVNKDSDMRARSFSREPCRKFLQGRCLRGASCPYLHTGMHDVPRHSENGSCKTSHGVRLYQDDHSRNHVKDAERSISNTENMDISSSGWSLDRQRKREFCLKFSKGRCDRGESCHYLHSFHEYAKSIPVRSDICSSEHKNDENGSVFQDGVLDEKCKRQFGDDISNPNYFNEKGEAQVMVQRNYENSGGVMGTNSNFVEADGDISLWSHPFKRRRSRSGSPFTSRDHFGYRNSRRDDTHNNFVDRHRNVVPFRYPYRGSYHCGRPRHQFDHPPLSKADESPVGSPSREVDKETSSAGPNVLDSNDEILGQKCEFEIVQSNHMEKKDMDSGVALLEPSCTKTQLYGIVMSDRMQLDHCVGASPDLNNANLSQKIEVESTEDVKTSNVKQNTDELVAENSTSNISKGQTSIISPEEVKSDPTSSAHCISPMDTNVSVLSENKDAEVNIKLSKEGVETSEGLDTISRMSESSHSLQNVSAVDYSAQQPEPESRIIPNKVHNNLEPALDARKDDSMIVTGSDSHSMQNLNSSSKAANVNLKGKLLILDVNGLLADIVADYPARYKPDTVVSMKAVFKRPFCDDFLEFCFKRFDVGVWSSRTKKNVDKVIDFLMGDTKSRLLFCWDQSHCTDTGYKTVENRDKPLVLKELNKLWEKQLEDLPWEKGYFNETNTVLLDDSPYKALRNPPYTAVFPYPYKFRDVKDRSLGPGGDLRVYLERLSAADNVQKFIEENQFGQRPITKSNLSWAFYSKITNACSTQNANPPT